MSQYFWYAAGVLTGVAAAFIAAPLIRLPAGSTRSGARRLAVASACVIAFAAIALLLYRVLGNPEALEARATTAPFAHPGALPTIAGTSDSVQAAAARLEERIAREGGSRSDWLLLAQSYEFLGQTAAAERSRKSAEQAPDTASSPGASPTVAVEDIALYEKRVRADARDAQAWLGLARLYRQQRDFEHARRAFGHLVSLDAMTADSWADYADVLGSLGTGSLSGESARAIERALALDPRHPKALWLNASLAHEEHRYADALALWKKIRALLPADSPDARIIDANIAEAAQLAGTPPTRLASVAAPEATVVVAGTVSIDAKLAARVPPGATLFIYAKAVDSPGPPLAVLRTQAASWPVRFQLDDTLAMVPERKLSSFGNIIVEARVSRSGNALPAPGDLLAVSPVLTTAHAKALRLVISKEIG